MNNLVNMAEYKYAKKLSEDFPKIEKSLDDCLKVLYNHRGYVDVVGIIWAIHEHQIYLTGKHQYYKEFLKQGDDSAR